MFSKKEGGLGLKNLEIHNQSLMMKWLWRFISDVQTLWKEVVRAKYGMEGIWMSNTGRGSYGVSLWKSIRNLWPKYIGKIYYRICNGRRISLWEDNWLGTGSLKTLFLDIHNISQQQEETMEDLRG